MPYYLDKIKHSYFQFIFIVCYPLTIILTVNGQFYISESSFQELENYKRENEFNKAFNIIDSIIMSSCQYNENMTRIESLLYKADLLRIMGNKNESKHVLDSIKESFNENFNIDVRLKYQYYLILGTLYLTEGKLQDGKKTVQYALNVITSNSNYYNNYDTLLGPCYNKLGNYYYYMNDYDSALIYYCKALTISLKKLNNNDEKATYLQNLGIIYVEKDDFNSAEKCLLESLAIKEKIYSNESYMLGRMYLNLSRFYQGISNFSMSFIYIQKAENIFAKAPGNHMELGNIYWNKGLLHHFKGEAELGLSYLLVAQRIIDSAFSENKTIITELNSDIGAIYKELGQYTKSIIYFNKAIESNEIILDLKPLRNLANLHSLNENNFMAELYYRKLIDKISDTTCFNKIELALFYLQFGEHLLANKQDSALYYLNLSLLLFSNDNKHHVRDIAATLTRIGEYYQSIGENHKALDYFHQGLFIMSSEKLDSNYFNNPQASKLILDNRTLEALRYKANCLKKLYDINHDIDFLISSSKTCLLYLDCAQKIFNSLKLESSKYKMLENMDAFYREAINICYDAFQETNDIEFLESSYIFSENVKSNILTKELQASNAVNNGLITKILYNYERDICYNLNHYNNQAFRNSNTINKADNNVDNYISNLFRMDDILDSLILCYKIKYPKYYNIKFNSTPVSIDKIRETLKPNEVIIDFCITNKHLFSFLISSNHFLANRTEIDQEFEFAIWRHNQYSDFFKDNQFTLADYNTHLKYSNFLYQKLLQPFDDYIFNKNLIIIPDKALNYISFESLITSPIVSNSITFKNLPYAIYNFTISYSPSSMVFNLINDKNKPMMNKGVIAFLPLIGVDSNLYNKNLINELSKYPMLLPGATIETDRILKLVKGVNCAGLDATEANFKKLVSNYDIIHFSAHTESIENNNKSIALCFSPDSSNVEDGLLYIEELSHIDLNGELAVLSSCRTGIGEYRSGEGVISLGRAFLSSGMRSIVMTLWKIEDISSSNIMPYFYYCLTRGMDKDEALRSAKIHYLKNNPNDIECHPAFWAGHVLYGNTRPFIDPVRQWLKLSLWVMGAMIIFLSFAYVRSLKRRRDRRTYDQRLSTYVRPEDRF